MSTTIGSSLGTAATTSTGTGSTSSASSGTSSTSTGSSSGSIGTTTALSNYATGTTSGTLSSAGVGSGLNVSSLVSSLMTAAQAPVTAINNEIASYQSEVSAYGQLSASVYTFQTALGGLTSAASFRANAATPSNTSVLTATATSTAPTGTYNINVTQLAQAQSLAAVGQASASAAIGSGASTTISFQFGTISGGTATGGTYSGAKFAQDGKRPGGTVTIDSSNNSLAGIAGAINSANLGVSAAVVNDGSGTPYRLTLTSAATGASSSMKITVSGDASLQSLLGQDPEGTQNLTETAAAQNALLNVNGLPVTSPSNTLTQTVKGTTLTLAGTGSSSLSVAQDTKTISAAVQSFVDAYNSLDSSVNTLTAAGVGGAAGGPLAGQYSALQVQTQMRQVLTNVMVDATGNKATLADIGITFQKDGTLALDSTKLNTVMAQNPAEIGSLFAQNGVASDGLINFVSAGSKAAAGSYQVNISRLATQGTLAGSAAANTSISAGSNDTLQVTVDGVAVNVTIPAGSYSADGLATAVQSAINGNNAISKSGVSVNVSQTGGVLSLTSASYGSNSTLSIGGNAAAGLFGASPVATNGVDVAGMINGIMATGKGQTLTGAAGSAVDGLQLSVTGGAIGSRGTLSLSQGFANLMNNVATQLNASNGVLTSATNALNGDIKDSNAQVTRINQQLSLLQAQYTTEFSKLDGIISSMNATQSYLTGQLTALANTTNYIYSNSSSSSG